jgi:hypothetical protein
MALRRQHLSSFLIGLLLFAAFLFSAPVSQAAKIDDLQLAASLDQAGSLSVVENLLYDFEDTQSPTVNFFLPLKYKYQDHSFKLTFDNLAVFDESGSALPLQTKTEGDALVLTATSDRRFFSGQVRFRLQYQVSGVVSYGLDQDLFYWDLTSRSWPLRIKRSQLQLTLPKKLALDASQLSCLSGPLDKELKCRSLILESSGEETVLHFDNTFELLAGESHRVALNLPKGFVYEPSWSEILLALVLNYRWPLISAGVLILIWLAWHLLSRLKRHQAVSDLQSAPPSGLTPAELALLFEGTVSRRALIAEILHLSIRGYLRITRVFNGVGDDYQLTQLQDPRTAVSDYQQTILSSLFFGGSEVSLLNVGHNLAGNLNLINQQLHQSLADKGHLVKNIIRVKLVSLLFGLLVMVGASLLAGVYFAGQLWALILAAALGIIIIATALLLPSITKQGRLCRLKINGFKSFLLSAEVSNQKNQVQFETYLPYSLVLGVEQDWSYQYKGVFLSPALWLSDSTILENYNSLLLVDTVNSFTHSAEEYLFN